MKKKLILTVLTYIFIFGVIFADNRDIDPQLVRNIEEKLFQQTGDKEVSKKLTKFIMSNVLTWKAKSLNISKANSILAFSFGNAYAKNGNQMPGKMNYELAIATIDLYKKTHLPIYAQWEIAQAIGDRVPKKDLHSIYGNLIYLDTKAVAEDAIRQAGGLKKLGKTLILAFNEHELRAVRTSRKLGVDAYAPKNFNLPDQYDKNSGQPWTRDKLTFMLYEIRTRANIYREELNGDIAKK